MFVSLDFAAGLDRSVQALLKRYVEMADLTEFFYASFHGDPPAIRHLLRAAFDGVVEDLHPEVETNYGCSDNFCDVLLVDVTSISSVLCGKTSLAPELSEPDGGSGLRFS